jgi:ABC-type polysaccharide/polyol phosphate export permease
VSLIADLRSSRELLVNLTLRELRGKYKRTVLGQAWSLLNPIAQMVTYSVVFSLLLRAKPPAGSPSGIDVFALWLSCGLLPWLFFSNVLLTGMTSLISNANLIQKVYFPRLTLVVSGMLALLVTFCIEIGVLVVALLLFGGSPLTFLPVTLVAMVVLGLFALGFALLLSVTNVYFRDTQHFVPIALQVWFYATPIIYPIQILAQQHPGVIRYYRLNPMERFTEIFRNTLYDARWPSLANVLYVLAWTVASLAAGLWVFGRYEGRLAEEL